MAKRVSIMKPTNLYEEASRRYQELLKIKAGLESSLEKAPPGRIHIIRSNNRTQFYLRKKKSDLMGEYISKSNAPILRTYIQKAYDEKIIKHLNRELSILESFLRNSNCIIKGPSQSQTNHLIKDSAQSQTNHLIKDSAQSQTNHLIQDSSQNQTNHFIEDELAAQPDHPFKRIQQIYASFPEEAKKYINPIEMPDEDYAKRWIDIPYVRKEIPEYLPCYETNRKEKVRSKSELNIANALAAKGIPYKYECPLVLKNGNTIHPDFTVLNIRERRVIYWEHRGMMDDKDYARNAVARTKTYMANGFYLGTSLIITEETSATPLGTNEIEAVIKKYVLGL